MLRQDPSESPQNVIRTQRRSRTRGSTPASPRVDATLPPAPPPPAAAPAHVRPQGTACARPVPMWPETPGRSPSPFPARLQVPLPERPAAQSGALHDSVGPDTARRLDGLPDHAVPARTPGRRLWAGHSPAEAWDHLGPRAFSQGWAAVLRRMGRPQALGAGSSFPRVSRFEGQNCPARLWPSPCPASVPRPVVYPAAGPRPLASDSQDTCRLAAGCQSRVCACVHVCACARVRAHVCVALSVGLRADTCGW